MRDFWEYDPQNDSWKRKADFGGVGRSRAVGFCIGSKGYIGTGVAERFFDSFSDFWEYDPATDRWTEKAAFAGGRRQVAVGFCIGNKGYLGTGMDSTIDQSSDFWEYNPASNQWSRKAPFKGDARFLAVAFTIGSKGYIGSGSAWTAQIRRDLWEYDPASDAWTEKAAFNRMNRGGAFAFTAGDKGYVGGGRADGEGLKKDFWEYDPAIDLWSQKADFAGSPKADAVAFSIGGKGYVGTGNRQDSYFIVPTNDFWEYDPVQNKWTRKADFAGGARSNAVGFSIGNKGYLGNGKDETQFKTDFWEYDVSSDKWTAKTSFPGSAETGQVGFRVAGKGYIGLGSGKTIWQYDPDANSWVRKGDFPGTNTFRTIGFSIGDKAYVGLGGGDIFSPGSKELWEYNPSADGWLRKTDFPGLQRTEAVAFVVGSKGYIGTGSSYNLSVRDFWQFDPSNSSPISSGWIMKYYSRTSLLMNGWGSYDPDGGTLKFQWKKVAGPFRHTMQYGDASTPVISDLAAGTYTFRLTVTDNMGATAASDVTFTVKENQPPVADGWLMQYYSPNSVLMNSWGSYDPDGFPVTFFWEKIAGPSTYTMLFANSSTPVISDMVPGLYKFQLTVTDDEGAKTRDTVEVTVNALTSITSNNRLLTEMEPSHIRGNSNAFVIYPTPVKDLMKLSWSGDYAGKASMKIIDISGKLLIQKEINKTGYDFKNELSLNALKPGSYFIIIMIKNNKVLSRKFVKE